MGEAVSKLTIDAGVQGGAAAAGELQKVAASIDATGAAAQAAASQAESLAKSQSILGRELAFAAESAKAAADALEQSDAAETLRLQAEAAELARPAIEALAEAQQRLAQLQAEQAKGPAGRSVGEMLAFNDAIAKQEGLIRTLGGEQQQFNTKTQDLVGILNRLNPRLGEIALATVRLSRISADASGNQGKLNDTISAGIKFVSENARTIGTLVGAGIAAVGVFSAFRLVQANVREETEKTTKALNAQREAVDAIKDAAAQRKQSIESISDSNKEGGLSAEEAVKAEQLAARIKGSSGELGEESVNTAVGKFFKTGASEEEIRRIAFGLQGVGGKTLSLDEGDGAADRLAKARTFIRDRNVSGATDTALARGNAQGQDDLTDLARRELQQPSGASAPNLERLIGRFAPEGSDLRDLATKAQKVGSFDAIQEGLQGSGIFPLSPVTDLLNKASGKRRFAGSEAVGGAEAAGFREGVVLNSQEQSILINALGELKQALKDNTSATQQNSQRTTGRPGTVKNGASVFNDA